MKYSKLTKEEENILKEFEQGRFRTVPSFTRQKAVYQSYAEATLNKTKNINIRLSEKILHKLKARAVEEGLPYQTLVASVLHQFANK